MKYKVAQIIPYFGSWPKWIELYFYSCGRNPMVDFIFYTNCPLPKHRYANTIFYQCTFEEYKKLVEVRLSLDYSIEKSYKLYDLKPFLGAVHEPELKEYDFWGFGDLDVVHGNLGMLVNDKMLTQYDFITTHAFRVAGHFTLCRNNEYYRNLCFKIKNWQKGLVDNKNYGYDEMDWSWLVNPFERNIDRVHRHILSRLGLERNKCFNVLNRTLLKRKHLYEYDTTPNPRPWSERKYAIAWTYDVKSGKIITSNGRELPYLHFMCFKKTPFIPDDNYWHKGYWTLDEDFEKYREIKFDYQKVYGEL